MTNELSSWTVVAGACGPREARASDAALRRPLRRRLHPYGVPAGLVAAVTFNHDATAALIRSGQVDYGSEIR
jgi:hypothetical protein